MGRRLAHEPIQVLRHTGPLALGLRGRSPHVFGSTTPARCEGEGERGSGVSLLWIGVDGCMDIPAQMTVK